MIARNVEKQTNYLNKQIIIQNKTFIFVIKENNILCERRTNFSTIMRVIKSRRMRWRRQVVRKGERHVKSFGVETRERER
jgi:hypothetical protein